MSSLAFDAHAQSLDGYASLMFDVLPDVDLPPRQTVAELRARIFAERRFDLGERARIAAAGFAEGLLRDAAQPELTRAVAVRPEELHFEVFWSNADLRVGLSRIVWGRLDEFQPTDVVNPLDVSRFFLEGRAEARLSVPMVRARVLPSDRFALEAVYVPVFRRGRFDRLGERTSPFNVGPGVPVASGEPERTLRNAQGGLRASVTTGRVDWALTAYRGFEPLPLYALETASVLERFPRFTMIGGDFETVRGAWGLRGEVAGFVDRMLQLDAQPITIAGRSVEGGLGVDRRAGDYRIGANLLIAHRSSDDGRIGDTDATIVTSLQRSFARETRTLRAFAVYNPADASAFARLIASFGLRDDVVLETSGGWFTGDGNDAISGLSTRDFLYARLKVFF